MWDNAIESDCLNALVNSSVVGSEWRSVVPYGSSHIALKAATGSVEAVLSDSVPSRVVEPFIAAEDAIRCREACPLGVHVAFLRDASMKLRNEHDHGQYR